MKKLIALIALAILIPSLAQAYTIKKGDTLWGLFGSNWSRVAQENGITDPRKLQIGQEISEPMMGAGYNPVTGYNGRTTQYISASATTIPVNTTKDLAGNEIDLTQISSAGTVKIYMTLDSGTSNQESVICTGKSAGVSWTGCTRGVPFQGSSETASTTLQKAHNAGTPIIITNIGQFYNQYVSVDGDQSIKDIKTFVTFPVVSSTGFTGLPTQNGQLVTKYYADNVTAGGFTAANVSTTKGTQALGTSPETVGVIVSSTKGMYNGLNGQGIYQIVSTTRGLLQDSNGIYITTTVNLLMNSNGELDANATGTPTASKIPISNASGTLDNWITATTSFNLSQSNYTDNNYYTYVMPITVSSTYVSTTIASNGADIFALIGTSTEFASFADTNELRVKLRLRAHNIATNNTSDIAFGFSTSTASLRAASTTDAGRVVFSLSSGNANTTAVVSTITGDGTSVTRNIVTGVDGFYWHTYEIVFKNTIVKFYVDGVLKFTHTTYIPNTGTIYWGYGVDTNSASITLTNPLFSQQL